MTLVSPNTLTDSRNLQKHTNANPLHRWLLGRFHQTLATLVEAVLAERRTDDAAQVLEVGCGEGFVTNYLSKRFSSARFTGLEVRREALSFAKKSGERANWLQGDAFQLPFRDHSVPVVVCAEVLEHLPDAQAALAEMRRVCSGTLILSVPNQPFFSMANFLRGKNLSTLGEDPEHVHHWRASTFVRMVQRVAPVREVRYAFPWVIAVSDVRS